MSAYANLKEIDSEVSNINYVDVGIHNNCEMVKMVVDTSVNGNHFIAFYFENEDGKTFSHTEWAPKSDDPIKLENKTRNLLKRVKHIATKYISTEVFDGIVSSDFNSFCSGVVKAIGEKYKGVKVRIKVTYNNKNFTSFPNYTPFIEKMDVEKTKLTIGSIDKVVKDVADREPVVTGNPFEPVVETSTTVVDKDDLPF
jgi:hypothetical protein